MSRNFSIAAGSAANSIGEGQSSWTSFFQKDVKNLAISAKHPVTGRILPARDRTLSENDASYLASALAYRDAQQIDPKTNLPAFTGWFTKVVGYTFFGRVGHNFISPQTLSGMPGFSPADIADPIKDARDYAFRSGDPAIKALTMKPTVKPDGSPAGKYDEATIPNYKSYGLLNMFTADPKNPQEWGVFVVRTGWAAMIDLLEQLGHPTMYGNNPYDPAFPQFLLGDITSPESGLMGQTMEIIPPQGRPFNGFNFTQRRGQIQGARPMPVDRAWLPFRYDLFSSKVLNILSYQEIVDLLVDDGTIPYHILQIACSHSANLAPQPARATVFPGQNPGAAISPTQWQQPQPGQFGQPALPPAPPAFNPAPSAVPPQFGQPSLPMAAPQQFQQPPQAPAWPAATPPANGWPAPATPPQPQPPQVAPAPQQFQQPPQVAPAPQQPPQVVPAAHTPPAPQRFQQPPQPSAPPAGAYPSVTAPMPPVGAPAPAPQQFQQPPQQQAPAPAPQQFQQPPQQQAPAPAPQQFQQPTVAPAANTATAGPWTEADAQRLQYLRPRTQDGSAVGDEMLEYINLLSKAQQNGVPTA